MTTGRRRRVLIVVSSYRPAMLADMQRARMLARTLPALGWDVEVLTPASGEVRQDAIEPDPAVFFGADESVHEVGSILRRAFELAGSRSPAWRTWLPMRRRGTALLRSGRFDLVYFSTTTFAYFALGAHWRRKLGVPYVLDFHDPWVKEAAPARPTGWKAWLSQRLAVAMERAAVRDAAGLVAVSPAYLATLAKRHASPPPAWAAPGRHAVIPFAVLEEDFAAIAGCATTGAREAIEIAYVGAGGAIMRRSFDAICRGLAALRARGDARVERVRIRLHGTQYPWRPGDPKELERIAAGHGLGGLVLEEPARVSYRRSLELLLHADAALLLGVDDAGYMPSKLFAYALSGKPLLAALHRASPAYALFRQRPQLGHVLDFDEREGEGDAAAALAAIRDFLDEAAARRTFDRREVLRPFLAPAMAQRHVELFEACLATSASGAAP